MTQRTIGAVLIACGLASFIVDRGLKYLALSGVTLGPQYGGFRFELLPNPAIAFSIAVPRVVSMVVIPLAMAAFVFVGVRFARRHDLIRATAAAVVVTGSFSNYLDRIQHGYVVDYLSLGNWFPVFNLSDAVIVGALVLLVIRRRTSRTNPSSNGV